MRSANNSIARAPVAVLAALILLVTAAACQSNGLPAPAVPPAIPPAATSTGSGGVDLAIQVDPDGAQVMVDGQLRGRSPITLTLPAGLHQMEVSAPGFRPIAEPITLTADGEGIYSPTLVDVEPPTVTLKADPPQVSWLGLTTLRASANDNRGVSDLQLLLDGQLLGEAQGGEFSMEFEPNQIAGLQPGATYTVVARAADEDGNAAETTLDLTISIAGETAASGTTPAATTSTPAPAAATAAPPTQAAPVATAAPPAAPTMAPTAAPVATAAPEPAGAAAEAVDYRVESVIIPTYPYTPYLRSAVDANASDYPVLVFDRQAFEAARPQPVPVAYTLLVLENRYVRLSLLPDLGGRIYELVFKPTGHDELYRNPVIKPTQWGPGQPAYPAGANWWLAAGGIEWGFPVEEHGYEWATQWGYDHVDNGDGSQMVTVFTRDYRRPYVSVSITLPPDSAAFTVQPSIVNPLAAPFRFKWWSNAMLAPGAANKPGADLRFIIPGTQVTVHASDDSSLPQAGQAMSWPEYQGRDFSRFGNWQGWLGFFGRPSAQAGYAGVYDTAADEGVLRVFPPDVARGVKVFAPGWSRPIDPATWTDDGSGYVELHGGLMPTFEDWSELPAGGQVSWSETWYPAAGLRDVSYAAGEGAVNVSRTATGVQVAVFPAHPVSGQIEIALPGQGPITRTVQIAPDRPFSEVIAGAAGSGDAGVTLRDDSGRKLITYRGALR